MSIKQRDNLEIQILNRGGKDLASFLHIKDRGFIEFSTRDSDCICPLYAELDKSQMDELILKLTEMRNRMEG